MAPVQWSKLIFSCQLLGVKNRKFQIFWHVRFTPRTVSPIKPFDPFSATFLALNSFNSETLFQKIPVNFGLTSEGTLSTIITFFQLPLWWEKLVSCCPMATLFTRGTNWGEKNKQNKNREIWINSTIMADHLHVALWKAGKNNKVLSFNELNPCIMKRRQKTSEQQR